MAARSGPRCLRRSIGLFCGEGRGGLGFRGGEGVWNGFKVFGVSGCKVLGLVFRVQGLGFGIFKVDILKKGFRGGVWPGSETRLWTGLSL